MRQNVTFKKEILKKNNLSLDEFSDYNLVIYDNKFDVKIKKFLRIMLLTNDEILLEGNKDKLFNYNYSSELSPQNERLMWIYINNMLKYHYRSIEKNNYSDLIDSLGEVDCKEKFDLKNMYILEEEEKTLLTKNLEFLKKKLLI